MFAIKSESSSKNEINWDGIFTELKFSTARSGGSGGQHVNKVETKVILKFDLRNSEYLANDQKEIALEKLKNRIDKEGILLLYNQESRSQTKNKEKLKVHFKALLSEALKTTKPRRKTKVPQEVKEKILQEKKRKSALKKSRGKPNLRDE